MQKYLIRRLLLVIPTLWLVISLLFLGVNLLPGDYVTIKLSNLEASGATTQPADIIGDLEIERTLHRVVAGDSVDSLALLYEVTPDEIMEHNPRNFAGQRADPRLQHHRHRWPATVRDRQTGAARSA